MSFNEEYKKRFLCYYYEIENDDYKPPVRVGG